MPTTLWLESWQAESSYSVSYLRHWITAVESWRGLHLLLSNLSWNQTYERRISSSPWKHFTCDNLLVQFGITSDSNRTNLPTITTPQENIVKLRYCIPHLNCKYWDKLAAFRPAYHFWMDSCCCVHKGTVFWVVSRKHGLDNLSVCLPSKFTTVAAAKS